MKLADLLYANNQPEAAAVFYQIALTEIKAENLTDPAWVNLQLGNCLRTSDRARASEQYRAVVMQYPDSPWAKLARVQEDLVNWWILNKPGKLVKPDFAKARSDKTKIAKGNQ